MPPQDPHVRRGSALDVPTIVGIGAGGVGLVAALVFLRFCGAVTVPPKPDKPVIEARPERVTKRLAATKDDYTQSLEHNARRAGLPTPTPAEMARVFPHQVDTTGRVLRPKDPPIEVAGLRLTALTHREQGSETLLALAIENPGATTRAYLVETEVSSGNAACMNRTLLAFNGNVVAPGGRELRSECAFKRGMELYVRRVETLEIPPLAAYYLSLVPPQALGVHDRVGRGHRPKLPAGVTTCQVAMSQRVRAEMEDGVIGWRDLADFYARHTCHDHVFHEEYRAFEKDGARPLPAVGD